MKYEITTNNLHIEDSYQVSKKDMLSTLTYIKAFHPDSRVWERTMRSLRAEWIVHNALYRLHLYRTRTKDVDLDQPCDRPEWVYILLSVLLGLIIR